MRFETPVISEAFGDLRGLLVVLELEPWGNDRDTRAPTAHVVLARRTPRYTSVIGLAGFLYVSASHA